MDLMLHENLIDYRVLLEDRNTAKPSSRPQFLAIVRAADLAGAHCEAKALVSSLYGHFDIVDIKENATPFHRQRVAK
jgi:hypothetical protein